jgi:TonB-linked SusC/RagA family outer membrane protein
MKKIEMNEGGLLFPRLTKLWRVMKITCLLMMVALVQVTASTYAQNTRLTLNKENTSLAALIEEVEKNTEFRFFYDSKQIDLSAEVTVKARRSNIEQILEQVFADSDVSYEIIDRHIILRGKSADAPGDVILARQQQQNSVSGKVTDSSNQPLPGVTVLVKGTSQGLITNADGAYSLINVPPGATLVFSFVGMRTQEVAVAGKTTINVTLEEETIGIEEVVAVGYGTAKRISLTGSFVSATSKELKAIPTSNVVTGLAGVLPGLRVTQRTGEPGAYNTLYDIRGFGNPLIVIDGLVSNSSTFVRLNPNEIEQVTVVKDAAAAIYGVQAANGVIIVTTKKGDIGKPKITYSGNIQVQGIKDVLPVGDAYTFATLVAENDINQGKSPTYSADDLQKYQDGTYPSTDWRASVANDYTYAQNHNISVTGGSERIKYFASMGYLDEMGLWKSGDLNYKKYNARMSVTGNITDNLEARFDMGGVYDPKNETMLTPGNILFSVGLQNPSFPIYANNNPEYLYAAVSGEHPIGLTYANVGGYNRIRNQNIQGAFQLNYRFPFLKGLSGKFLLGVDKQDNNQSNWRRRWDMYTYDELKQTYSQTISFNVPSNLTKFFYTALRTTVLVQGLYENTFAEKHNVKATLAFEERHDTNDNFNAKREFTINIDQLAAGIAANQVATASYPTENRNQNFIGRANYDFATKYLFEFGFNYSGSSRFPAGKRWGFFPYGSVGWRLSEEGFFKNALPFISNLKLRGSYGIMGDDGAAAFQYVSGYSYPSGNYIFGSSVIPGLGFRAMPNMDITWFTVKMKNIAIDFSALDGLIYGQLDLFQRDRSGLLATRLLTIPGTVGASLSQENLNEDRRRGFETVIGSTKTFRDFRYDASLNITYTRGMPTKVERANDANSYLRWRNSPVNRYDNIAWGYKYIGQFQSVEEAVNSPMQDGKGNATIIPGDLKYEDVNKDGIINDLDLVPIGRGTVNDLNFGLNTRISYKQFDLNILFQGAAFSNYSFNGALQQPLLLGRNTLKIFMDRWHREDLFDPNSAWVPGKFPSTNTATGSNTWVSSFWRPDASYLRLKQLEIGYTVKSKMLPKAGIDNLRVYLTGFNLLTWTKIDYVDPELDSGWWNSNYPITNIFNLGVNITF